MARTFPCRRLTVVVFAALAFLASTFNGAALVAQAGAKSDREVKVTAAATKLDGDNMQVVTVSITINKGWHIYANPVTNEDLTNAATVVTVTAKEKPEDVKVAYPAGTVIKDKTVGDYKVYEDKVEIKATVKRAKGDTSPMEVSVKLQTCNDKTCLLPATVKVTVP